MEVKLKRALKFNRLVAITMGTPLASSVFLSILLMVFTAGDLLNLVLSIIVATVIVVLASLAYGQLVSVYPSAAGNRIFLKKPMGDTAAIVFSLMWIFILLAAAGVESYTLGYVMNFLVPLVSPYIWSILGLAIILGINLIGVEISGNFQTGITYFVALSLVVISLVAIFTTNFSKFGLGSLNIVAVFTSAAIGVYFFLGFARVTTLGEETVDYERGIPKAMPIGVLLLGVLFMLVSISIFEKVPFASLQTTVIPQVLLGKYLLPDRNYAIIVAIISVIMSFTTFNAGLLGTSRLVYALGREGVLPTFLGKIESRHFTPYFSLIFLFFVVWVFVTLVYLTKNFSVPVLVAAGFDSFMYGFTAYSAFWHKRKLKAEEMPFNVKYGQSLFLATAIAFTVIGTLLLLTSPYSVTLIVVISIAIIFVYIKLKGSLSRAS